MDLHFAMIAILGSMLRALDRPLVPTAQLGHTIPLTHSLLAYHALLVNLILILHRFTKDHANCVELGDMLTSRVRSHAQTAPLESITLIQDQLQQHLALSVKLGNTTMILDWALAYFVLLTTFSRSLVRHRVSLAASRPVPTANKDRTPVVCASLPTT